MIKMGIRPHVDVDRKGVFHIYITVYNEICSATYTQNIYIYIHIYIVEYADNISWVKIGSHVWGSSIRLGNVFFLNYWIVRIGGLDSSLCDLKQPRR